MVSAVSKWRAKMERAILKFNLVVSADGTVTEYHPSASKVAKQFLGEDFEMLPGGMIVMSTDVNSTANKGWIAWAKGFIQTLWNRFNRVKIVDKELLSEMRERGEESGWSIGNLFHGRYYNNESKMAFNEKSFCVDIRGVPIYYVKEAGRQLGLKLNQSQVLIVDHSNNRTFMLDAYIPRME